MRPSPISAGVWRLPMCQASRASASGAAVTSTSGSAAASTATRPAVREHQARRRPRATPSRAGRRGAPRRRRWSGACGAGSGRGSRAPPGRPRRRSGAAADGEAAERAHGLAERAGSARLRRRRRGSRAGLQRRVRHEDRRRSGVRVRAGPTACGTDGGTATSSKLRMPGGVGGAAADRAEPGGVEALGRRLAVDPQDHPVQRRLGLGLPQRHRPRLGRRLAAAGCRCRRRRPRGRGSRGSRSSSRPRCPRAASNNKPLRMGRAADHALSDSRSRRAWEGQNARGGAGTAARPLDHCRASA